MLEHHFKIDWGIRLTWEECKKYDGMYTIWASQVTSGKESTCQCRRHERLRFDPWFGRILWSRKWHLILVFLTEITPWTEEPGGLCPWGCKESDVTVHSTYTLYTCVCESVCMCVCMPYLWGLPRRLSGKESACQCRRHKRLGLSSWVEMVPWRRKWQPTPAFLYGKSHGQRSLVGYRPWDCRRFRYSLATKQQKRLNAAQGLFVFQIQDYSCVLFCVYWKTMETLACKWGGWLEFGISAGPGTKEVFTRYLSNWIIKLYSLCQRNFCK